jgi:peroxiredoxin
MSAQRITPGIGTIFPDAEVVTAEGSRSTLRAEFQGPATVLYFMRSAHCPVCGTHVRALVREANASAYGEARVVIVVPGDADAAQHIVSKTGAAVTVLASSTAHAEAGLHVKTGLQQSGTFVLDANGMVRAARVATVPTGAFDHREVIEALRGQHVVA